MIKINAVHRRDKHGKYFQAINQDIYYQCRFLFIVIEYKAASISDNKENVDRNNNCISREEFFMVQGFLSFLIMKYLESTSA